MNFGGMLSFRFGKEEIDGWTSLKKSGYILLPLLVYLLVHDLVEVLLWACINQMIVGGNGGITDFLIKNAATVQGIVNGLMILAGVAAIWKAVKSEILWVERHGNKAGKAARQKIKSRSYPERASYSESVLYAVKEDRITEKKITDYAIIAVLAFCAALGLNLLFNLLGITASSETFTKAVNAQYGVDFLAGLFLYGIVSPIAEESVFRGVMYNRMKRCFGYYPALLLSALLFGGYHGNYVQAIYGSLLGILIAYVYEKHESFAAPVLFHAVANVSVYVMTYHNSFLNMGRMAGIVVTLITAAAAVVCICLIMKKNAAV